MILQLPSFVIGYVLGSIPMAHLIVRRARGIDIRNAGSGNVGALNSFLVTGSAFIGAFVLLLDFLKGFAAVKLSSIFFGEGFPIASAAAAGAIVGHNYSIWLKGRGGRGLATAAGAFLMVSPATIPVWMIVWGIGFGVVRDVNFGSVIACVFTPLVMALLPDGIWNIWTAGRDSQFAVVLFVVLTMIVILTKLVRPMMEYLNTQRRL